MADSSERRELTLSEKNVAKNLKAAYKRAKATDKSITQEWIAKEAGCNQPLVAFYLNGKRPIGTDTLVAICKAIGVGIAEIDPERAAQLGFGCNGEADEVKNLYLELDQPSRELIKSIMKHFLRSQ